MANEIANNKRLARNTLMLYLRMFVIMAVSLYTSRVVLATLGVDDYGVYNVVGSIVVLFYFVQSSLISSTQRFMNFSLGKDEEEKTRKVFSMCMNCQLLLIVIFAIILETVGLWLLNRCLDIPEGRMHAANVVYHFSVISTCFGMLQSPYNAAILAYEKMSIYAYISILEAILKLVIVYLLIIGDLDKLILYGFLVMLVGILISAIYIIYCLKNFRVCRYVKIWDKDLFNEVFSFSGWSLLGNAANVGATQGLNMIFNMFFGVALNAAFGVANQVNTAVNRFVTGFETAYNPQITKSVAAGEKQYFDFLLHRTSKFSFFLLFIVSLPVFVCCSEILDIWLVDVPQYTATFCQLLLVNSLIDGITTPLWMAALAEGNIRTYQIVISVIKLLVLPLAILELYLGMSPALVLGTNVILNVVINIYRLYYLQDRLNLSIPDYNKNVVLPTIKVIILSAPAPLVLHRLLPTSIGFTISIILFTVLLTGFCIFFIGMTKSERNSVWQMFTSKLRRRNV